MSTPRSLEHPRSAVRHTVRAWHGELVVLDVPAAPQPGRPLRRPVLLVPGFTGSKEDFLAVLEPLAAHGRRVMAIDMRGQHESPPARETAHYEVQELGRDVLALVSELGGGVHVLGHSFGGLVVRDAAIADPTGMRSLTLLCSGPGQITQRAQETRLLAEALRQHDQATVWQALQQRERDLGIPPEPPHIAAFLEERWMGNDHASVLRIAEQLLEEPDRSEQLAAAGLPVLVVHGSDDDAWTPAEQSAMAARIRARYEVVPGAGHSPAWESSEATAAVLATFFADVEDATGA